MSSANHMLVVSVLASALAAIGCADDQGPNTVERLRDLTQDVAVVCGEFHIMNTGCPSVPNEAMMCLQNALAQRRVGRLRQISKTIEGGTVTEDFFTADLDGWAVAWFHDSRNDPFGAETLVEKRCAGVAPSNPTVTGCRSVVATECDP